ncbi:hypothetical protein RND64_05105 [Gordonia sp. w5E2]|uniref:hypothetical protein n=1 Tax=Gordonia sp. w5E2 TaxID=3075837 RepID=UPI002F3F6947
MRVDLLPRGAVWPLDAATPAAAAWRPEAGCAAWRPEAGRGVEDGVFGAAVVDAPVFDDPSDRRCCAGVGV